MQFSALIYIQKDNIRQYKHSRVTPIAKITRTSKPKVKILKKISKVKNQNNKLSSVKTKANPMMAPVAPDHQVATTSTQITADVPTKTRKKRKIDPNGQTTLNIPTDNKFALLSDDDDEDDEMTSMTPQRQQSSQQPQDTNSQSQKSKKTNPIVVKNITSIEVQRYVTENAKQKSTFKKTGSPSTKQFTIFPANLEEKKRIIKILTDKGYSHHTYTEKEDRRLSFVLAGVDFTEPSALKETLIANNIPAINVSFLSRNPD